MIRFAKNQASLCTSERADKQSKNKNDNTCLTQNQFWKYSELEDTIQGCK